MNRPAPRTRSRIRFSPLLSGVLLVLGCLLLVPRVPQQDLTRSAPAFSPAGFLGGKGGAHLAASTTAETTMHGAKGENGTCTTISGSPAEMVQRAFHLQKTTLTQKYQNDTQTRLCLDHWIWKNNEMVFVHQMLETLHWPKDLLQEEFKSKPVIIVPPGNLDPSYQEQKPTPQQTTSGFCYWEPDLLLVKPKIDLCAPIKGLVRAIADGLRMILQSIHAQVTFLWETPTAPFTDSEGALLSTWRISWGIVLGGVVVVLAWVGLRILLGGTASWLSYATALEALPRIIFGLLLAFLSQRLMMTFIEVNNGLATVFSNSTFMALLNREPSRAAEALMHIIYAVMGFFLIAEAAARMAILYLLFSFAPLLLFAAALQETEFIARMAVRAMIWFSLLQAMQLAILSVGGSVIASVLQGEGGDLALLNALSGIIILYLALMLFFSITNLSFGAAGTPIGAGITTMTTRTASRVMSAAPRLAGKALGSGMRHAMNKLLPKKEKGASSSSPRSSSPRNGGGQSPRANPSGRGRLQGSGSTPRGGRRTLPSGSRGGSGPSGPSSPRSSGNRAAPGGGSFGTRASNGSFGTTGPRSSAPTVAPGPTGPRSPVRSGAGTRPGSPGGRPANRQAGSGQRLRGGPGTPSTSPQRPQPIRGAASGPNGGPGRSLPPTPRRPQRSPTTPGPLVTRPVVPAPRRPGGSPKGGP